MGWVYQLELALEVLGQIEVMWTTTRKNADYQTASFASEWAGIFSCLHPLTGGAFHPKTTKPPIDNGIVGQECGIDSFLRNSKQAVEN